MIHTNFCNKKNFCNFFLNKILIKLENLSDLEGKKKQESREV